MSNTILRHSFMIIINGGTTPELTVDVTMSGFEAERLFVWRPTLHRRRRSSWSAGPDGFPAGVPKMWWQRNSLFFWAKIETPTSVRKWQRFYIVAVSLQYSSRPKVTMNLRMSRYDPRKPPEWSPVLGRFLSAHPQQTSDFLQKSVSTRGKSMENWETPWEAKISQGPKFGDTQTIPPPKCQTEVRKPHSQHWGPGRWVVWFCPKGRQILGKKTASQCGDL